MSTPCLEIRRPLVGIETAKAILNRSEDEVLSLCESGKLAYSFDFKRESSHRRTVRILSLSLYDFAGKHDTAPPDIQGVLRYILPGSAEVISLSRLSHQFNLSGTHLNALLKDGCFVEVPGPKREAKESRNVTRASACAFIQNRRFM